MFTAFRCQGCIHAVYVVLESKLSAAKLPHGASVWSGGPFARVTRPQSVRTMAVTSVAPRAWACCKASSAEDASSTWWAMKVTTNRRSTLAPATPAPVRRLRVAVGAGAAVATGV